MLLLLVVVVVVAVFFVFIVAILHVSLHVRPHSIKIYALNFSWHRWFCAIEQNTLHNLNKNSRLIFSISRNYVASVASYYTFPSCGSIENKKTIIGTRRHQRSNANTRARTRNLSMPLKLSETMSKILHIFVIIFDFFSFLVWFRALIFTRNDYHENVTDTLLNGFWMCFGFGFCH